MARYYGTFGPNHKLGSYNLDNCFIVIIASSYKRAFWKMYKQFGNQWSTLYTREKWLTGCPQDFFPDGPLYKRPLIDKVGFTIERMKKRKYDKVCKVDHGYAG